MPHIRILVIFALQIELPHPVTIGINYMAPENISLLLLRIDGCIDKRMP